MRYIISTVILSWIIIIMSFYNRRLGSLPDFEKVKNCIISCHQKTFIVNYSTRFLSVDQNVFQKHQLLACNNRISVIFAPKASVRKKTITHALLYIQRRKLLSNKLFNPAIYIFSYLFIKYCLLYLSH